MSRKKIIVGLASAFSIATGIMITLPSEAVSLMLDLSYNGGMEGVLNYDYIRPIHFGENKNDFGGLFYFEPGNDANKGENQESCDHTTEGDCDVSNYQYEIEYGENNKISCKEKKGGFYYNAERGERLRPLSEETMATRGLADQGLSMTGGIFTNCPPAVEEYIFQKECCTNKSGAVENHPGWSCAYTDLPSSEECHTKVEEVYADPYSYYGIVTHEYSGQYFVLAVGVKYATGTPWVGVTGDLGKTFQAHPQAAGGGKLPFGLIYDTNGGVGFAGCKVERFEGVNQLIESGVNETGIINLFTLTGEDLSGNPYLNYIKENPSNPYFKCKDIGRDMTTALGILVEGLIGLGNASTDYSIWDTKIEKSQYFASANINNATLINHARQKAEVLCRGKWTSNTSIKSGINCLNLTNNGTIDLSNKGINETIIVKNGNVIISPFTDDSNDHYDIFIDSGNLIINEAASGDSYDDFDFIIKNDGFVSGKNIDAFISNVDSIWNNIAVNGQNPDSFDNLDDVGIASIIKGNFIVNGHLKGGDSSADGKLNRKYFIYGKLTSLDSNEDLRDTFAWRCNSSLATYGKYCPSPQSTSSNAHPYQNVPLAIIDQNYDSPLLK